MRKQSSNSLVSAMRKVARDIIKVAEDLQHIEMELGRDKPGSDNDHNADWEHVEQRLDQPFENVHDYARMRQPAFEDDDVEETPAPYKEAQSVKNNLQGNKAATRGFVRKSSIQAMPEAGLVRKSSMQLVKEARAAQKNSK